MKYALSIAGTDPTSGAGIQADLRVFAALGVHGLTVVAALTAQDTRGVSGAYPVPGQQVRAQLECLLEDVRPGAMKTGMLYSKDAVLAVADAVRDHKLENLVIDPVAVSTSGKDLLEPEALAALKAELLPLARVITPNLAEAALLTGLDVQSPQDMEDAARALHGMGPGMVIITGGHLQGHKAVEVLYDGHGIEKQESPLLPGRYHGTGCAYSAAITACLALDVTPAEAASRAKTFVTRAIKNAIRPSEDGMGILRFN